MKYIFYYLTEDSYNLKERNEVSYLRSIGRVVVVRRGGLSSVKHDNEFKILNLPRQSEVVVRFYELWTKICYLLARSSDSLTDRGFPSRNLYTGNAATRWLINILWPAKYNGFINRFLLKYETLYFLPFKIYRLFIRDKFRSNKRFQRIVVHDSLIIRVTKFTNFILVARRCGFKTIANVKSWDNPFYTQFICGASGYLTWSQRMWHDIQNIHKPHSTANHIWGPRPFYNFVNCVLLSNKGPNTLSGTLTIGYAAAYCDNLMAVHEIQVLNEIAKAFLNAEINVKILLRPYPTVPISTYNLLKQNTNIEIADIQGNYTDRYGDGREIIRFGSDEERIEYLSRCHCFLSIATSFTFEAAVFGLPVIQYFVPKEKRNTDHELHLFERLDISDHILNYFLPYLPVVKNTDELIYEIKSLERYPKLKLQTLDLLNAMGFPPSRSLWDQGSAQLVSDLQLF